MEDSELPSLGSCPHKQSPLPRVPTAFHFFYFLGFYLGPTLSVSGFIQGTRVRVCVCISYRCHNNLDSILQFIACQGMSQQKLWKPLIQFILKS